jgi:hypothetical protein
MPPPAVKIPAWRVESSGRRRLDLFAQRGTSRPGCGTAQTTLRRPPCQVGKIEVGLTMQNTNATIIATGDPLPTRLARSWATGGARRPLCAIKVALVLR